MMQSFDEISSPELELGLEDDVLTSMMASPQRRHGHPVVPKWMRSTSSSSSSSPSAKLSSLLVSVLYYLRDHVYPSTIRCVSALVQRLEPPVTALVRPRLTVRYVLLASLALYAFYRLLTSQPLLASRLPAYTGPYGVGAVDIEVPLDQPRRVNDMTFRRDDGKPAFEVETVLFTLYYPTSPIQGKGGGAGAGAGAGRKGETLYWVPSPISATAKGYARFLGMDNFVVRNLLTAGLWLVSPWGIPIPAQVGAPVLQPATDADDDDGDNGTHQENKLLPVMVFTHGMLSSRTDYTSYLGELASRGVVVAALEHRDGSSPGSLIRRKGQPDTWRYWFGLKDLDTTTATTTTSSDGQDKPKSFGTAAFKEAQLSFREAEIEAAVTVLRKLNTGSDDIASQNSRQPPHSSTSSTSSTFLAGFQNRLNTTHLLLGGHSYGGTGALRALRSTPSPSPPPTTINTNPNTNPNLPFTGAIILDPGKSSGPLNSDISIPLLIIHSASWSKRTPTLFFGRPHFDVVREIVERLNNNTTTPDNDNDQDHNDSNSTKGWFLTSLGTSHPSITDAPLLEPLLLSWATGSTMNGKDGIRQYVDLTWDFAQYQQRRARHGLLALPEDAVVREYKPKHNEKMPEQYRKYWQIHVAPD